MAGINKEGGNVNCRLKNFGNGARRETYNYQTSHKMEKTLAPKVNRTPFIPLKER